MISIFKKIFKKKKKQKDQKNSSNKSLVLYIKNRLESEILEARIRKEDAEIIKNYFTNLVNSFEEVDILAFNITRYLLDTVIKEAEKQKKLFIERLYYLK